RRDLVAGRVCTAHQLRPAGGVQALEEERRAHFEPGQDVEDARRVIRVRAVVEGEGDAVLLFGRLFETQQLRGEAAGKTEQFHRESHGSSSFQAATTRRAESGIREVAARSSTR